jgi:hypothetical protein
MNLSWNWRPPGGARRRLPAAAAVLCACAGLLLAAWALPGGQRAAADTVQSRNLQLADGVQRSGGAVRSPQSLAAHAVSMASRTEALHRVGTVNLATLARSATASARTVVHLRTAPLRLPPGAVGVLGKGVTGGQVTTKVAGNVPGATGFDGLTSAISGKLNSPAGGIGYVSPPDPTLAAGASPKGTAVLEFVNDALSIYSPTGNALLRPIPAYRVFGLRSSALLSNPRAFYDSTYGFWYLTATVTGDGVTAPLSAQYIAVSDTSFPVSNPFGKYVIFSFSTADASNTAGGCPCFADVAQIGINIGDLYISTSQFSVDHATFDGTVIYEIPLGGLNDARGLPAPVADVYSLPPSADPFGAFDLSPDQYAPGFLVNFAEYFVESDANTARGSGLEIYALLDYGPSPALVEVTVPTEAYALPPVAAQRRGPVPYGCRVRHCATAGLDSDFDAVQQVTYARGILYAELDTGVRVGKQQRSGIAWFAISLTPHTTTFSASLVGQGYLESTQDLLDPVIAVNGGVANPGLGYMAFAVSSLTRDPSAGYVAFDGPQGPVGPIRIAAAGTGPLDEFTCYPKYSKGICRFGDYSAAEYWDRRVYMVTEYIGRAARDTYSNWDTRIWSAPVP